MNSGDKAVSMTIVGLATVIAITASTIAGFSFNSATKIQTACISAGGSWTTVQGSPGKSCQITR